MMTSNAYSPTADTPAEEIAQEAGNATNLTKCPQGYDNVGVSTTEHTINDALADLLKMTRRAWAAPRVIRSEKTSELRGAGGRPDIIIAEPNVPPLVVETEILPAATVEVDARSRIGVKLRDTGQSIYTAVAVRLPKRLSRMDGDGLRKALTEATDLEFALLSGED